MTRPDHFDQFVHASIEIKASQAEVWHVLTEHTGDVFMGATFSTTWRVGTPIVFSGEWQGSAYRDKGIIQAFSPAKRLAFTQFSSMSGKPELPENYDLVTFQLNEAKGGTNVTLALAKPRYVTPPDGRELDSLTANLHTILDKLKDLAEL